MGKWGGMKPFSAWLNVAPNTKITGGKIISSKMEKKKNQAGQTLRMACSSISMHKGPLGEYSRKMKARLGKKGGVVATANKLSRIIYTMIKEQKPYDQKLVIPDNETWKKKRIAHLEKQLNMLKEAS